MPSAPETENDVAGSEGNTPDSDPAAEAAWEQEARCETCFFHLEVLSETVEAKTVETLERKTESATEESKQETTEENNKETASESKQTEEETKQTETTETGTEDAGKDTAPSKEAAGKETTEEIQQDGNLYDMGGEMRKASRVAKVRLRKAAGGLDSNYVYLDTTGMDLNPDAKWSEATQLYLFKLNDGINFTLGKEVEINGKKYWRWQVDGNTNQFGFSFTNKWGEIDNTNYYRTVLASVIFSQAGGKVFASDGKASEPIHNQEVYALKDITAEIANKMP